MNENEELYMLNKTLAESFIEMAKNHYDLQLDFSKDSIQIFEKVIEAIKNKSTAERKNMGASLSAYLGHLLLSLFEGYWFQNQEAIGVCLRNTGLGENLEVYPGAWIEKRLKYGKGDSIEFKISVLADFTLLEARHNTKWTEDTSLSEEYAKGLDVSIFEKEYVDKILNEVIDSSKKVVFVNLDYVSQEALKYLKGRFIKLQDSYPFNFGMMGKLEKLYNSSPKSKLVFAEHEFLAFLKYLQNSTLDPNGGLFKCIWNVEKDSSYFAKSSAESSNEALLWMLILNAKKGYHHDIIDFKKILNLIAPKNEAVVKLLPGWKLEFEQGCYKAIKYIMNYKFCEDLYSNFDVQRQIIAWLDNASGGSPKKPWEDKLSAVLENCKSQDLSTICQWMINHGELKYDEKYYWRDAVFSRFQKSAGWYLNSGN